MQDDQTSCNSLHLVQSQLSTRCRDVFDHIDTYNRFENTVGKGQESGHLPKHRWLYPVDHNEFYRQRSLSASLWRATPIQTYLNPAPGRAPDGLNNKPTCRICVWCPPLEERTL